MSDLPQPKYQLQMKRNHQSTVSNPEVTPEHGSIRVEEKKDNKIVDSKTSTSTTDTATKNLGAASQAYEAVKDAWTWGRHDTPFGSFLGVFEIVTNSAVHTVLRTDMKGLDDGLKPHVAALDDHVVNPVVHQIRKLLGVSSANVDEIETR